MPLPKSGSSGLSRVWEVLGPGGQRTAILCVDGQWLRLLVATGAWGSRVPTAALAVPIEGLSQEDVVARLKDLCDVQGIAVETVLVSNPSHLTTARLFTVPSSNPAEIRDIIELQAEKHTPYAKEEILTDFSVIETDSAGYSRVMLVISHQDVIYRALRIVKGMGWTLERVGFELEGLVGWLQSPAGSGFKDQTVLLADVDTDETTLVVVRQGKALFHRSISSGAAQIAEHPEEAAKFAGELSRSLEAYESEGQSAPVGQVVLTGVVGALASLGTMLGQQLKLPVAILASTEKWSLSDNMRAQVNAMPVACTSLLGLALHPGEVDLTPPALRLHRTFEVRARALLAIGCQLIFGVVLLLVLLIGHAQKAEHYHALLTREHRQTSIAAETLELSLEQLGLVNDWLGTRGDFLGALLALNKAAPASVRWTAFSFSKEGQISVRGISNEMPPVYDYVSAIQQIPNFSQVEAKRVTKKRDGDSYVTEFEIVCRIGAPSAEAEPAPGEQPG